ncbi:Hypothetical predicted protein [Paramuricea clavata]|uniref:Uncharacterized protein n=1 Tax=Paramuricea clavata TaxID=317549 RepID=A0A7D9HW41_PARCT|nr:Hypothetical predicted protein [Paramuricea clavata]
MSEVNPDTAAVPVTNPEGGGGRRLAKISKEAKARKKARFEAIKEEQNVLTEESENERSIVTLDMVGLVVGIAVGLGSLYVMCCSRQEKDEKPEESRIVEEPEPVVITPKGPDLFD